MRGEYPILDNRPIDQWKVTELREELRRRKLATKGLKEDLVKRLDEAIRGERELLTEQELNNNADSEPEPHDEYEEDAKPLDKVEEMDPNPTEIGQVKEANESVAGDERKTPENEVPIVEIDGTGEDGAQAPEVQHELTSSADLDGTAEDGTAEDGTVEDGAAEDGAAEDGTVEDGAAEDGAAEETVVAGSTTEDNVSDSELTLSLSKPEANGEDFRDDTENRESKPPTEDTTSYPSEPEKQVAGSTTEENVSHNELAPSLSKSESNGVDFRHDMENRESKPPTEDTTSYPSEPEKQVPEVSPDLGFPVKCESISTDSVTINEKIELKDNLNANNFHLELEVGKPETVQPSSSDVAPVAGDFNPLDIDQEPEDNQGCVEEMDDATNTASLDLSNKIDNSNGGSPEKLNLDRSSGDESMEEDVLETKPSESNNNSDEIGDTKEVRELHVVKEGSPVDAVVGGLSPEKKDVVAEETKPAIPAEKRKLEDQGSVGTTEPVKRQRRWNAETIKVPEPQPSNQTPSTTPKDIFQSTPRRIFNRTDSGLSVESPKERFVPPSQKTATTSLRIDRFLRPFTLKAVQELLAKTGTVCNFWMDHIKTHCYVTYSSVEEAMDTRNALYNLQWPPNGGRLLTADFVDSREVKMHVEAPPSPAPVAPGTASQPSPPSVELSNASQPPQQPSRQQLPPPALLPQPPPVSQPPPARERDRLPLPPPPTAKKPEPPILTLDDLFKKTRATPRIYYLPLSEEQVAAKLAGQGRGNRV